MNQVILIQTPKIDFDSFLSMASQSLGFNPAVVADKSSKKMVDSERFIWILQSMKDIDTLRVRDYFFEHINISAMFLSLTDDLLEIAEICVMPHISTTTLRRDVSLAVITGNLKQWREAMTIGCSKDVSLTIGTLFTEIYQTFVKDGFGFVWSQYNVKGHTHGQLLLEYVG